MYAKLGDRKFEPIEHANKKEGRKRAANTALLKLQREGKIPRPVRLEDKIPRPVRLEGKIPRPVRLEDKIPRPVRLEGKIPGPVRLSV